MMASIQGKSEDNTAQAATKETQITAMLVSISILFILTSFPQICLILSNSVFGWTDLGIYYVILYNLFLSIVVFLRAVNHALNFYLYCLSAQFFRDEAKKIFCKCGDATQNKQSSSVV